jgi:quercetin dioxygenase-like cupin family protein
LVSLVESSGVALYSGGRRSILRDEAIIHLFEVELIMKVIHQSQLPFVGLSHEFVGAEHGQVGISFFLVNGEPGRGPRLHKHNYDEIVYVIAGQSKWIVGDKELDAVAGDVLIVKAGEPHKFICSEVSPARQIDIHLNPAFETEWLE